jgi:hypothetical protein
VGQALDRIRLPTALDRGTGATRYEGGNRHGGKGCSREGFAACGTACAETTAPRQGIGKWARRPAATPTRSSTTACAPKVHQTSARRPVRARGSRREPDPPRAWRMVDAASPAQPAGPPANSRSLSRGCRLILGEEKGPEVDQDGHESRRPFSRGDQRAVRITLAPAGSPLRTVRGAGHRGWSRHSCTLALHSPGSGRPSSASRGWRIRPGRRTHSRR